MPTVQGFLLILGERLRGAGQFRALGRGSPPSLGLAAYYIPPRPWSLGYRAEPANGNDGRLHCPLCRVLSRRCPERRQHDSESGCPKRHRPE